MGKSRTVTGNSDFTVIALSRLDTTIEWLLTGLLAFMPLAFGVVHAWSKEVVVILSGAIVICFLTKLLYHRNQKVIWSWAYIPAGVFLVVAAFQLIPLPTGVVSVMSPGTSALKMELLSDLPNAMVPLESTTLSFYPYATKHDLRLVLSVAAVFVVVLNVFRRPDRIKRLLMTIALIGGVVAMIALAQGLFGNDKIYWFISSPYGTANSGPFVNHSNYAQFMSLSIGAALGWLCVKLCEDFRGKKITPHVIVTYLSSDSAKLLWLLVGITGLGVATIFASLSRGGMVSMFVAAGFTILVLISRRAFRGQGWIIVAMVLIGFVFVLYMGFDAIYNRLATLGDFDTAQAGRLQILKDITVVAAEFPVLGMGLGAHSVVYPMFDRSTTVELAAHAENEYAQALEETGLVGLASLIMFGIIVWSGYLRNVRRNNVPVCSAAYGLGFGLIAILIHSLSDFGQHLPANAFLSAIFCALLLGLTRQGESKSHSNQIAAASVKSLRAVVFLAVFGVWLWVVIGANGARISEAHWKNVHHIEKGLVKKNWQGTDAEYADLISHASRASDYEPENVRYRYWLNVYRWRSISQVADPNTGETVISEDSMGVVRDIVDELHKVFTFCPTYGPAYSTAGQIEKFILGDDGGAARIRRGFLLAPCDPVACFAAGQLDVAEGKVEDCIGKLERAVQLDPSLFGEVIDIYVNQLSRPRLAMSIAGEDIHRLSCVASILDDMQYNDFAEQTREKVKELLEAKCSQSDASASAFVSLGDIYSRQHNNEAAIGCYRRALALNYGQVYWRLKLARMLAEMGRIPEAMDEARICLRLRPQLKPAKELLAELSVRPAAFAEE